MSTIKTSLVWLCVLVVCVVSGYSNDKADRVEKCVEKEMEHREVFREINEKAYEAMEKKAREHCEWEARKQKKK